MASGLFVGLESSTQIPSGLDAMDAGQVEKIQKEVQTQVKLAMLEFREQLQTLQAQVSELQQQGLTKLASPRSSDSETVSESAGCLGEQMLNTDEEVDTLMRLEAQAKMQKVDHLPANLYAYCMAQLTLHPERLAETITYLICQQGMQLLLLFALWCGSSNNFVGTHWNSLNSSHLTPGMCMFENKVLNGHANQDIAAALVILFLASMTMMADDRDQIASIYPCERSPLSTRAVAACAWCIQSLLLPCFMVFLIPSLLSTSMNTCDVVMNGLAITFIIKIGDLLYECVPRHRRVLLELEVTSMSSPQRCARLDPTQGNVLAWSLMVIKFVCMAITYVSAVWSASAYSGSKLIRVIVENEPTDSAIFTALSTVCLVMNFAALPVLHSVAWQRPSDVLGIAKAVGLGLLLTIFGLVLPLLSLGELHSRLLGFSYWDADLWVRCYNQTSAD